MASEELNPMQKPRGDAQRALLEKCLRGEFALTGVGGHLQAGDGRPQPVSPRPSKELAVESAEEHEVSVFSSRSESAKRRPAVGASRDRKSLARQAFNRCLHLLCRFGPGGYTLRPLLHRMRGVRIGKNVWIGDDVYLDNESPERIEIEDGAMIELRTTILAHTHGNGRVVIGKNAVIGAGAVVVTAGNRTLTIGEGSVIMASSLVTGSVAPYTFYGSDASKPLARITKPFTATTTYEEFMTTLRPLSS